MHDIKKRLIILNMMILYSLPTQAQIGCIDDTRYSQIQSTSLKRVTNTLTVRLKVEKSETLEVTSKRHEGILQIKIYGSYITQDHIQLSPTVILLEYPGYTQLNVVKGKGLLSKSVKDSLLILTISL